MTAPYQTLGCHFCLTMEQLFRSFYGLFNCFNGLGFIVRKTMVKKTPQQGLKTSLGSDIKALLSKKRKTQKLNCNNRQSVRGVGQEIQCLKNK